MIKEKILTWYTESNIPKGTTNSQIENFLKEQKIEHRTISVLNERAFTRQEHKTHPLNFYTRILLHYTRKNQITNMFGDPDETLGMDEFETEEQIYVAKHPIIILNLLPKIKGGRLAKIENGKTIEKTALIYGKYKYLNQYLDNKKMHYVKKFQEEPLTQDNY